MPSRNLEHLFENNRRWAEKISAEDPQFFAKLAELQAPEYLWIGCSDSRVPANQITGLLPGEVFVHRNIANVVAHTDLNCLSVVQFAVDVLKVRHIMVVGHYGCGGVCAALENQRLGLIDNWLRMIQDVRDKHQALLDRFSMEERNDRLCELNVIEQVVNLSQSTVVRDAWMRGQDLTLHGWVYRLTDGLVQDTGATAASPEDMAGAYRQSLAEIATGGC
ncbi:carbonate dehydratase [Denitratisoma sp. DHT3]|uniref:carbonate dehydratase n=1 Tax=Denitratisoma sp. DHT3 TaxID=1981880 RepID=UPI0011983F5D|nr:carbonate dehydratase [Denitratisoma sp. DHT3]QDX82961.1 carbonate dehydratase [Denitratisoma sp. DHT3]